jgi:hypothetical protein
MKDGYVFNWWRKYKGLPVLDLERVYAMAAWLIGELTDGATRRMARKLLWLSYIAELMADVESDTMQLFLSKDTRVASYQARIKLMADIEKKRACYLADSFM